MPENQEDQAPPDAEALRKRVEDRAYALWECEGKPHGRDLDHWRQAESEILAAGDAKRSSDPPSSTASGRKKAAGLGG